MGSKRTEQRDLGRKLVFRKLVIGRSALDCIWELLVIYTLSREERHAAEEPAAEGRTAC